MGKRFPVSFNMVALHRFLMSRRLLLSAAIVLLGGCSEGPVAVSGRVTYEGKPAPVVFVKFAPQNADGSAAWATTDGEGNFTLHTAKGTGALPGDYRVWFEYRPAEPVPETGAEHALSADALAMLAEKHGRESSTLTATITGPNDSLSFDLK
jgi:hypothetical protein